MSELVSTNWVYKNLNNRRLVILDCSWHMSQEKRNAKKEYEAVHIKNAYFFDINKISDIKTNLPHMVPTQRKFEKKVRKFGINQSSLIVAYDVKGIFSSPRVWWMFKYFGHKNVFVLNGGLKKWKLEKKITTNNKTTISKSKYKSQENKELVKDKNQINTNINKKEFVVIDARGKERFEGKVPEPRKNVRRGSIPNSLCLPYREIINENNTFKNIAEISKKFDEIIETNNENRVFSCGSGITAAVLGLAYSMINDKYLPAIYDGSWAEYGKIK